MWFSLVRTNMEKCARTPKSCRRFLSQTLILSDCAAEALDSGLEANCSDDAGVAVALGAAVDNLLRGWAGHGDGGEQKRGGGEDFHVEFGTYCF
jgi:hypothetical protein